MCVCALGLAAFLGSGTPSAGADPACPNEAIRVEQHSTYLPDCRAYEKVSPADKNGGDVIGVSSRTRAAVDGNAVDFATLTGFDGAQGSGISFEYIGERTAQPGTAGWSTHAITPANLDPRTFTAALLGFSDSLYSDLAPDLSRGLFLTYTPLTADSPYTASEDMLKIYRRDDLRSPGPGEYRLVSDCPVCTAPANAGPGTFITPAGASSGFSHVLFESRLNLTAEASGLSEGEEPKLYEWVEGPGNGGTVTLAGMIPSSGTECGGAGPACVPAPTSQAGAGVMPGFGQHYALGTISQNGSRVYFTVGSPPGPQGAEGPVYLRADNATANATTTQINVAEPVPNPSPQPAFFAMATPDGSKAFFTTKENLISEDTSNENLNDLYMYDSEAEAGHHLTLISKPDPGMSADLPQERGAVIGASSDGSYVYFVSQQQLLSGKPSTASVSRIYVWHNGLIHEVAAIPSNSAEAVTGIHPQYTAKASRLSADGSHLLFLAKSTEEGQIDDLPHSGGGDACPETGGCREAYLYDATASGGAGTLLCTSCRPDQPNSPAQANALIALENISVVGRGSAGFARSSLNHPLSDDGRYVFFSTADSLLLAEDTNGVSDAYSYDSVTGEVHLLSGGTDPNPSYFLDASPDGSNVFFITRARLLGWDADAQADLYDARIDGGFSEPAPLPAPCAGLENCHSTASPSPFAQTAGSSSFEGPGNLRHPRRCPRGRHRVRVRGKSRCVKTTEHQKRAGHNLRLAR